MKREFCDSKYVSEIQRPFVCILILVQPELMKKFLGGLKSQMGFCPRMMVSILNRVHDKPSSVRYGSGDPTFSGSVPEVPYSKHLARRPRDSRR